jgi:hypothetical protein
MKSFVLAILILVGSQVNAQFIKLSADSTVRFNEVVQMHSISNQQYLFSSASNWLLQQEKNLQLQLVEANNSQQQIVVQGLMPIDDASGTFNNINCKFTLQLSFSNSTCHIQWYNMYFEKNGKQYAVADIYNSIRNQQPLYRVVYESKKNALTRHNYIIECLQKKVTVLTQHLKDQIQQESILQASISGK